MEFEGGQSLYVPERFKRSIGVDRHIRQQGDTVTACSVTRNKMKADVCLGRWHKSRVRHEAAAQLRIIRGVGRTSGYRVVPVTEETGNTAHLKVPEARVKGDLRQNVRCDLVGVIGIRVFNSRRCTR